MVEGRLPVRVNGKRAVAEFPEYGIGAEVPARPAERRVAVHVLRVTLRTRIEQQLDGLLGPEGGGTMKRSLSFRSDVSHEGGRLSTGFRNAIGVRAIRQQDLQHQAVDGPVGLAGRCVERCLACVRQRAVHIGAVLDEELTQPPMPMERGPVEAQVVSKRVQ